MTTSAAFSRGMIAPVDVKRILRTSAPSIWQASVTPNCGYSTLSCSTSSGIERTVASLKISKSTKPIAV